MSATTAMSFQGTMATILCCVCGVEVQDSPTNMCLSCVRENNNILDGINRQLTIHSCRSCNRFLLPPWQNVELESKELLAACLRKINGLNKVKLVDAVWIWTEPHSLRLKIKITVQKEIVRGAVLQQAAIIDFTIRNQQCVNCQASFATGAWKAIVAVRQRVPHKRTFLFLEQLLLKHNAHSECLNIMTFKDGMDFYFGEQQQANRFVDFLSSHVPVKTKYARKLLSADHSANVGKFRHNHLVEIAPLCKDDLVLMPTKLAANLSNISPLALVKAISAGIHVVDPLTGDRQEIDMEKYWRHEFPCKMTGKELVPFIVLSVEPLLGASAALRPSAKKRGFDKKVRLAECVVAREKDFGVNDMQYTCVTHLGNILKEGDTVMGYDLAGAAWANERETQDFLQTHGLLRATGLPDVVLVRKKYASKSDRFWELRSLEMETGVVEAGESNGKYDGAAAEKDYELFLQELEADKEMRANVNLYKAQGGRGKKGMEVEADEMDGGLGADAISKAKSRKGRSKLRRAKMDAIADEEKKAREKAHAEENMDDSDAENANNDYDDDEEGVRLDELLDEMTLSAGDAANAEVEAPVVISQEQAAQSAALQLETSGFDPADFAAKPFKFT